MKKALKSRKPHILSQTKQPNLSPSIFLFQNLHLCPFELILSYINQRLAIQASQAEVNFATVHPLAINPISFRHQK